MKLLISAWPLFGILFSGASLFAAETGITFDQRGSLSKIVGEIASSGIEIVPPPAPSPAAITAKKKWTIMVYVNAKNNLEGYGLEDVNEMEKVGSSADVNVIVELGRIKGHVDEDGGWVGSRRYIIRKDDNIEKISSPVLAEIIKSDMGDWTHLVDFAKWSMAEFPAEHYALVIWNHGTGWRKNVVPEISKGISYDDETKHHITTPQLGRAMESIGKIDILSMDACLMQMAEVAYEVKDFADYIVGSEETEFVRGNTYDRFLAPLVKAPEMTAKVLAQKIVDAFVSNYENNEVWDEGTHSVIKTSAFNAFIPLINDWIKTAMDANEKDAVAAASAHAQSFDDPGSRDMYHFIQLTAERAKDPGFIRKSHDLLEFMKKELIDYNRHTGFSVTNANGLAAHIPNKYLFSLQYSRLKWAADTQWQKLMRWYN